MGFEDFPLFVREWNPINDLLLRWRECHDMIAVLLLVFDEIVNLEN